MKIQIIATLTDGQTVTSMWGDISDEDHEGFLNLVKNNLLGGAPDSGGYLSLDLSEDAQTIIPKNRIVTITIRRKDDD